MRRFVVFVILSMVVIGSCAAQSSANEAQRIVGTWVSETGSTTYVFNANGTGTVQGGAQYLDGNIFWGISSSGQLSVFYTNSNMNRTYDGTFFLSSDGRRMIWLGSVYQKR